MFRDASLLFFLTFKINKVKVSLKNKTQDVVYIEYFEGTPHSVLTAYQYEKRLIPDTWDFFQDAGNNMQLSHHNSGSGGDVSVIECPSFRNPEKWKVWHDKRISFKNDKNVKVLKNPIILTDGVNKSRNPFVVSVEVYEELYCKKCDGYHSEICREHMFEDEEDDYQLKYTDGELVE